VAQKRFEIEQQKLAINNFNIENNYKLEQLRSKIAEIKETLERQARESQKLAARLTERKEILDITSWKKNELIENIEHTKSDMAMRNEELEVVQKDKDFIRNYLR
jgi:hypothetical protein